MPFFSVIIPLYNKSDFIIQTMEDVLHQSFDNFEIIIVNDGSTDDSLEKAQQFTDDRIRIFCQQNQGVSAARNKGMSVALGNYFCFLDADDEWMPDYLENLYQTIVNFPNAGMYCSRYKTKIGNDHFSECRLPDLPEDYQGYVEDFFKSSYVNRVALTSAVAIDKKVFLDIGGFDVNISSGQDLDYWIRIVVKYPVAICKGITMIYNYLPDNRSLSKTKIGQKTLPDLDKFDIEEKKNPSLKKFLDIYRIEYALHFHISGNNERKNYYLKKVDAHNRSKKVDLLLATPPSILRFFLFVKRYLKRYGIDFSVYH